MPRSPRSTGQTGHKINLVTGVCGAIDRENHKVASTIVMMIMARGGVDLSNVCPLSILVRATADAWYALTLFMTKTESAACICFCNHRI